jgi:hypothetical protein
MLKIYPCFQCCLNIEDRNFSLLYPEAFVLLLLLLLLLFLNVVAYGTEYTLQPVCFTGVVLILFYIGVIANIK